MKKIHIKQLIAFVVFLTSAAAMDSQLYIPCGLLAVVSAFYLLIVTRKEQSYVYAIRGSRVNQQRTRTKGNCERPYLERYPLCNERKHS